MHKKIDDELLTRGVAAIVVRKDLTTLLETGKPLRIKHGVDPTRPDLHLGHAAMYRKLRQFQDLGHTVIFLIGDFTARFGDPTDKVKSRVMHDKAEVEQAAKSYIDQVGKILDASKLEIRRNSEWYDRMSAEELLRIMSNFTVARMLERDMFEKRRKSGEEIGLHEPVYPVLQAYDSVMLQSDLTVIGSDQTFNELQARPLQEFFGQKPQQVMSLKLLVGTDGKQKMSKSLDNHIGITDAPEDMFGKLMSLPDSAMETYAEMLTDLPVRDFVAPKNPRQAKALLAQTIVSQFHGAKAGGQALEHFEHVFTKKQTPVEMQSFEAPSGITATGMISEHFGHSKSESRRLIEQKAVKHDGRIVTDPNEVIKPGVYQVGKRRFKRLVLKKNS